MKLPPVLVTCGPAFAPLDDVRRITNFATGEIGAVLANALAAAGRSVVCFRGEAATSPMPFPPGVDVRPFTTNADLGSQLEAFGPASAVFHAAALGDFEVEFVRDQDGELLTAAKIPSRAGHLLVGLRPAPKILPSLRSWFPGAKIVGWKYELVGDLAAALHAGAHQIAENGVDACVVNGAAYGEGFGLLDPAGRVRHFADKPGLAEGLVRWLAASA